MAPNVFRDDVVHVIEDANLSEDYQQNEVTHDHFHPHQPRHPQPTHRPHHRRLQHHAAAAL